MIKIEASVAKSWLSRKLGVAFDRRYYFQPRYRHSVDQRLQQYVREQLGELGLFCTESNLGRLQFHEASDVLVGGIQPNMIVGMLLGAAFLPVEEADADISANCLHDIETSQLPAPEALLGHPIVKQFDLQIQSIQRDPAEQLFAIPPFFWDRSGRAAVHGAVTSGLKFCGDDFFLEMVTEPERCRQLVNWLTETSIVLVRHFAEAAGLEITGIHVGECASCMVDKANFELFIVPATSRLGRHLGPVRFHSCGASDHLLESCRRIENLTAIDVGGETSVAAIRSVFGRDFPVGIAPLVDDMTAGSATGILAWFERVAAENDGGDLTIGYHLEDVYNLDCIRALHRCVAKAQ